MTEYRASFDADVTFLNGGGLQANGFRLDIPDAETAADAVADLFVKHLGLLMVDRVRIDGLQIIAEPHKGSRGGPSDPDATSQPTRSRLVELSHVIEADSPYSHYADRADLADVPLAAVADVPAVVVRLTGSTARGIEPRGLAPYDVSGAAVLLHTGWDRHWRTDAYAHEAPYLTEAAARRLGDAGARLVGIDSVSIDDPADGRRPAHSVLLDSGIPVLEHLTGLDQLPITGARLHAAPPRVRPFSTFPVRAYAVVPD